MNGINKICSYREFLREAQLQYNNWSIKIDKIKKTYDTNVQFNNFIEDLEKRQQYFNYYLDDLNNQADEKWFELRYEIEKNGIY